MGALPSSLALASIADGSLEVASDHRNNYAAIQAAVNALIADLAGGTAGSLLQATSTSAIGYLPDAPADKQALVWSQSLGRWAPVYPAGYELGYDQITSNVNVASTTEGTPTSVIAGTSRTYEAVPYMFEFFCNALALPSTTGGSLTALLMQDGSSIGRILYAQNDVTGGQTIIASTGKFRFTPSAGAHTYGISAYVSATTGTPGVNAGAGGAATNVPTYLRVTKA